MKEKTYSRTITTSIVKILDPTKPLKIEAIEGVEAVEEVKAVRASKGVPAVKHVKAVEGVEAVEAVDTYEEIESFKVNGKTTVEKQSKKYYKQTKSTCFIVEVSEEHQLREITDSLFMEHSTVVEPKKTEDETKEI